MINNFIFNFGQMNYFGVTHLNYYCAIYLQSHLIHYFYFLIVFLLFALTNIFFHLFKNYLFHYSLILIFLQFECSLHLQLLK